MRPDNCTFDQYEAWFQGECNAITLKPGISVVGPYISAVNDPRPPWDLAFAIIYDDGMYIWIWEHYRELSRREGAGGRLQYFSYHYGPGGRERDGDGFPVWSDDCVLRIDLDLRHGRHAHYAGDNHILEPRLIGLDFDHLTPFAFIRAVEEFRVSSKPLPELLGFEVRT